jgi:23S rRNA (cytosine1962-C5)-methyltransferase
VSATRCLAVLKPHRSRGVAWRHPWVRDTAVHRVEGRPADGDPIDVVSDQGKFLARGFYNGRSRIRVRLYTWTESESLDDAFWRRRIESALRLRAMLGYDAPQSAARLVFSEGDGLSGLIVDRYGEYLVMQVTALAVARRAERIAALLAELVRPRGIIVRTEPGIARTEGIEIPQEPLWGEDPTGPVVVDDRGLRFIVHLREGQKTGFYLDQRENRRAVAAYCRGRDVLDMYCYSGGFSLAASAWGGAASCLGVDSSEKAIDDAAANAAANGLTNLQWQCGEAFSTLEALAKVGRRFGVVVLDPPKFARNGSACGEALRAYHWLNRCGVELVEPGGILVSCSCSGLVTRQGFFDVLAGVAQQTRRPIQVLQQRGASPDHPVATNCPESEYLKCLICRVG